MSACKPKLVVVYKSQYHGHAIDIGLNFKFSNAASTEHLRAEYHKEVRAKEKAYTRRAQYTDLTKNGLAVDDPKMVAKMFADRHEGIDTKTYVTVDPYRYISDYESVLKLPTREAQRAFRAQLNAARRLALLNLEWFIRHQYDVVYYSAGEVEYFIQQMQLDSNFIHDVVLVYNYNSKRAFSPLKDIAPRHNISRLLKVAPTVYVFYDKRPALQIDESITHTKYLRMIDEADRVFRHISSVSGGAAKNMSVWLLVVVVVLVIGVIYTISAQLRVPATVASAERPDGSASAERPDGSASASSASASMLSLALPSSASASSASISDMTLSTVEPFDAAPYGGPYSGDGGGRGTL
jgi:hypothetical protein